MTVAVIRDRRSRGAVVTPALVSFLAAIAANATVVFLCGQPCELVI